MIQLVNATAKDLNRLQLTYAYFHVDLIAIINPLNDSREESRQGRRYGCVSKIVDWNAVVQVHSAGDDRKPPMTGPSEKPTPKATPSKPWFFATSFGSVISAIYARVTETFALNKPPINLANKAIIRVFESPKIIIAMVFPINPIIRTGRRPILSDNEPQNGEKIN